MNKLSYYMVLSGLLASGVGAATAGECPALERMKQLRKTQDFEAMKLAYEETKHDPCVGEQELAAKKILSAAYYQRADDLTRAKAPQQEILSWLEKSVALGQIWQAQFRLGEMLSDAKDYQRATVLLQAAIETIKDLKATPTAPPTDVIKMVVKKAEESQLLASGYVPYAKNARGGKGGLASDNVRDFVVEKAAIPVTFEYNSVQFDAKGRAAAQDLLEMLREQNLPAITLVGHTDPKGDEVYNQRLSEARAEALKDFLLQNGYRNSVSTAGRGKREPYQPDDPGKYSEEERYQMDRRVELLRQ